MSRNIFRIYITSASRALVHARAHSYDVNTYYYGVRVRHRRRHVHSVVGIILQRPIYILFYYIISVDILLLLSLGITMY